MTTSTKDRADALALAIETGLLDPESAVSWGCDLVVENLVPHPAALELASAVHPHPLDVVGLLRAFPGRSDPVAVCSQVFACARDFMNSHPERWSDVTMALERLATHGYVPVHLEGECYAFDDRRRLAEQGAYGTVGLVRADLVALLKREAVQGEPTTSREVYVALIKEFARSEFWDANESSDYPPRTVWIRLMPRTETKLGGRYDPSRTRIEIYREGLTNPIIDGIARAAAQAQDPTRELVVLAHELGHHLAVVSAVGAATVDGSCHRATYREEVLAWCFARRLLEQRKFLGWSDFDRYEAEELGGYRDGFGLSHDSAMEIEEHARREFAEGAPANSRPEADRKKK